MKVAKTYSHLNGEEWLLVHQKEAYKELLGVITSIDAEQCRTKASKEKRKQGRTLYSPVDMNREFDHRLRALGWKEERYSYYVAHNHEQYVAMIDMSLDEQREYLQKQGTSQIYSYNQTDHVKHGIAVEVQFGKYAFVAYDLFVKHLAFYSGRLIHVGVEVLPTKAMQSEMSSGVAYYEGELHNILRGGRSNPPVPLVLIGVEQD